MYSKDDILAFAGLMVLLAGIFIISWRVWDLWIGAAAVMLVAGAVMIFVAARLPSPTPGERPEPKTLPPGERGEG